MEQGAMCGDSPFLKQLEDGLTACGLRDCRLLLAVSGGADSLALLRGTLALAGRLKLELCSAHLNHNLRGEQSQEDARWLTDLCRDMDMPLVVGSEDVRELATRQGTGIEECARQVRYAFLERTALEQACTRVAVAHTADDQAETILHHVLRGTGVAGLRGMPRVRPLGPDLLLARPMLDIRRDDVEAYLNELSQPVREDASNLDPAFTRNRIRQTLLPLLERDYNPNVREALLRLGRQAADVQHSLETLAGRLLDESVVDKCETICRINCERLSGQPRHLIRECLIQLWKSLNWPRQQMGFAEWDRLAELVISSGTVTLPGEAKARRRGQLLVLRRDQVAR